MRHAPLDNRMGEWIDVYLSTRSKLQVGMTRKKRNDRLARDVESERRQKLRRGSLKSRDRFHAARFSKACFNNAVAAAHPEQLPGATSAGTAEHRSASDPRRRQGRRLDGARLPSGTISTTAACPRTGLRGLAVTRPRLCTPDTACAADRSRPSRARCGRTWPRRSRRLSLADAAGPDDLVLVLMSGGASANWIAPSGGPIAHREAGADPRAARIRRIDLRDQRRAQASLAHQRRPPRRARISPARVGDGRDFRRARRRSGGDRIGPDRSRIRPRSPTRAPRLRAIASMCPTPCSAPWTMKPTKRRSPATRCSRIRHSCWRSRPSEVFGRIEAAVRAAGYDCILLGTRSKARRATVAAEHARLAREAPGAGSAAPSSCPAAN